MNKPQRCLIVDTMHPSILPLLKDAGVECEYLPSATREDVLKRVSGFDGIMVRSKLFLDAEFFEAAHGLQWVARAGAGTDNIDLAEAQKHSVEILNAPEGNQDSVAEHVLGMLLSLLNHIPAANTQVRQKIWQRNANRGRELKGKTVGLIGYGHMGRATAERLQGFGCSVLAFDKYLEAWPDTNAMPASLSQIFVEADIVSLHIPLTDETTGWVNEDFFRRFQKKIWFINTSRGGIVSLEALQNALSANSVLGACLDVLENEKLDQLTTQEEAVLDKLIATGKVLFTPHVAGWTEESYERINHVLTQKIVTWIGLKSK
jgi:D-3-phosphoglycerate dehydrogenase